MKTKQNKHQAAAHVCKDCGASRSATGKPFTAISLKYHQVKAHPPGQKEAPAACGVCGRSRSALGKPFTRATLLMHQAKSHPESSVTGQPPVKSAGNGNGGLRCDLCGSTADRKGQAFRDQASLRRHQRAAHWRVAPAPALPALIAAEDMVLPPVKFCPACGCNLQAVHAALDPTGLGAVPALPALIAPDAVVLGPVKFCPTCGCNIQAVQAALAPAGV